MLYLKITLSSQKEMLFLKKLLEGSSFSFFLKYSSDVGGMLDFCYNTNRATSGNMSFSGKIACIYSNKTHKNIMHY